MDFEENGARSAPSGLTFEERLGGAQSAADGAGPQRGGQPATGHTIGFGEAMLNIEPRQRVSGESSCTKHFIPTVELMTCELG